MKVVFFQPPGRFPTVVHDFGRSWEDLSSAGAECLGYNANVAWWKLLCSGRYISLLSSRVPLAELLSAKLSPGAGTGALEKVAALAGRALSAMKDARNYTSPEIYAAAIKPFSDHIRLLNYLQPEFRITAHSGPEADGLDYSSSAALAAYAQSDTLLSASVEAAISDLPADADVCMIHVTSPQDLLCGLIAARLLRLRNPSIYLSILSHDYENFSLGGSASAMEKSGAVFCLVDSIVRFGYQRSAAALFIMESLAGGVRPAGFVADPPPPPPAPEPPGSQPLHEVFSPEPVFWTRISDKRCYWSRCTFCVQNVRRKAEETPDEMDVERVLARISGQLGRGCGHFYFCDEAVAPALLEKLCRAIAERKLAFKWACRCRIDAGYTKELFSRLKAAGCYEVLFGVESVSPRVQRLMNKYGKDMPEGDIRAVVEMAKSAGLNIHLTFLTGFPGETLEEAAATLRFAASALKDAPLATYYVNIFNLYPGSEVFKSPARYGITYEPAAGDLPAPRPYSFSDDSGRMESERLRAALPGLIAATEKELGWANLESRPEYRLCRDFYFNYGHGAFIKSAGNDIFYGIRSGRGREGASPGAS